MLDNFLLIEPNGTWQKHQKQEKNVFIYLEIKSNRILLGQWTIKERQCKRYCAKLQIENAKKGKKVIFSFEAKAFIWTRAQNENENEMRQLYRCNTKYYINDWKWNYDRRMLKWLKHWKRFNGNVKWNVENNIYIMFEVNIFFNVCVCCFWTLKSN